jgi:hypothetical protein
MILMLRSGARRRLAGRGMLLRFLELSYRNLAAVIFFQYPQWSRPHLAQKSDLRVTIGWHPSKSLSCLLLDVVQPQQDLLWPCYRRSD